MAKKSYGCTVFGLIALGAGAWYAYGAFMAPLQRFETDARSLVGKTIADADKLLGAPNERVSYRDHRTEPRIQDLVELFPGIKPTKVDYKAHIYLKYKRCAILYVTRSGQISNVEFGQIK